MISGFFISDNRSEKKIYFFVIADNQLPAFQFGQKLHDLILRKSCCFVRFLFNVMYAVFAVAC